MPADHVPSVFVDARFNLERKGGDRCRFELAKHLPETGLDYAFLGYDSTAEILKEVVGSNAVHATDSRPWNHPSGDLFEHVGLPRLGKALNSDIYHGTFNVLPIIPGLSPAPRLVVTIHDVAVFRMPEAYSPQFCMLSRFLLSRAVQIADRIIVVSSSTRAELLDLFPRAEDKVRVILNGVGNEFRLAALMTTEQLTNLKRRLNLPDRYVLFVGNLEKKKNLPRILSAFATAKVAAKLPHQLLIVGSRPAGVPEVALARALEDGFVTFTGYLPDDLLPGVYRGSDLVVYPSLYEGFGMPVLEGLAAGVPVLTSNISSMPEVGGGAPILVDPLSIDDIAAGIVLGLTSQDWRTRAVPKGLARAGQLSWTKNAMETAAVYLELSHCVQSR